MSQQTANPGLGTRSAFVNRPRPKDIPVQAPPQATANATGESAQQALAPFMPMVTAAKSEGSDTTADSAPDTDTDKSAGNGGGWGWTDSDAPEGGAQQAAQPSSTMPRLPPDRDVQATQTQREQANNFEMAPLQSKKEQLLSGFFQMPVPGRETQNSPQLKEQTPKTSTSIFSARPKVALRVSATKKQKREGQSFAIASSEPDVGSNVAAVYETGLFMTESEEDKQTPIPGDDEKPMKITAPTAPAAARCPHDAYATPAMFNGLRTSGDIT
jgi:hypothetical protein